jgi:hypothetical protein
MNTKRLLLGVLIVPTDPYMAGAVHMREQLPPAQLAAVDALNLTERSKSDVASILGKPSSCTAMEAITISPKKIPREECQYPFKGKMSVVFTDNKADYIIVQDSDSSNTFHYYFPLKNK